MVNIIEFEKGEIESQKIEKSHLDQIIGEFKKNGFIFLKSIFPKELINSLNLSFQNEYKKYFCDANHEDAFAVGNKRFQITIDIKNKFNDYFLFANPIILSILKNLFTDKMIISDITCVTSLPGAKKMKIHRDGNIFIGNPLTPLLPPHAIGLLIPLIPFDQNNGTTRYWPQSQKNNLDESSFENDLNYFDANSDLGDCVLMDYRVVHVGNENKSDQIRPLLYINYAANWYFDPNNFNKQTPLKH